MNLEIKQGMEMVLNHALKQGADACDIIVNTGETFSLSVHKSEIEKYQVSGSKILGIRVIKKGRVGISYSESFSAEELKKCAENAISNSDFSDVNEFEVIEKHEDKKISRPNFNKIDNSLVDDKIKLALFLESDVLAKDKRIQSVPYNGISEIDSHYYYLNSVGKFHYNNEKYFSCYTSAMAKENSKNTLFYRSTKGRTLKELDVKACIDESVTHALNLLTANPVPTGSYDVVFSCDMLAEFFSAFSPIFSGKSAMDKSNPFVDRVGEKIATSELTIKDSPRYDGAFFYYDYDSEGTGISDLTLVENGILKSFYHNSVTARYFKTKSTGHASRSPKSALGISGTNQVISLGTVAEADVLKGRYLEIHNLDGLHSGSNSISGDFSFGASGYLCENGKRLSSVNGITVAGNFFQVIKDIKAIGNKSYSNSDMDFFAPIVRFSSLKIAGS